MGFRFRRSFRLMPGIRMNVSKSGVSTSFGSRGAWFTVGPRGTRTTLGIPGTGLSYTTMQSPRHRPRLEQLEHDDADDPAQASADFVRGLFAIVVVFGAIVLAVTLFTG
jgi:uncharacterized protein DUF4236